MHTGSAGLITVDLDGLDRLAGSLTGAGEQLSGAGRGLAPVPGLPVPLEAAVDDFCDSWRRSLQRTGDAAQTAGAQLRSAGEAYRRVERAIAGCA